MQMKTIYVTTVHVHEVPLSLVANDGGQYDNLELNPLVEGDLMFARSYTGVQKFAFGAGADPEDWGRGIGHEPIFSINLEEVFT